MKKILLTLSIAMMLTSCGLYSKYDGVTAVDEKLYGSQSDSYSASVERDSSTMMGNISWREVFADAKLQSLIEVALEKNTNVRTAMLNVENAQTALKTSRLAYMPSLALSASGSISGLLEGGSASKTYTIPATASWELDLFGSLRNDKERAKMVVEQVEYVEQGVRAQIVSSVANLYYTLSMLKSQVDIAEQTLESVERSVATAQSLKSAGYMNEAGVAQLEASLLSVENSLLTLQQAQVVSENAMRSLLALSLDSDVEVDALTSVTIPESISVGVPLQLLSSRPDVMAAEAALAASFYSENMARASFYPSISLSGTLGWTNDIGVIVNPAEFIYNAVGSLVQPIFSKGLNRAQLNIAKNTFEQSKMTFEQTLLDAGIEVNSALATLHYTTTQAANYTQQVEKLSRAERSTQLLMEYGTTTYLEVLTAQQTLYSTQLQQVANMYDQMSSVVSLYSALGGGRF